MQNNNQRKNHNRGFQKHNQRKKHDRKKLNQVEQFDFIASCRKYNLSFQNMLHTFQKCNQREKKQSDKINKVEHYDVISSYMFENEAEER